MACVNDTLETLVLSANHITDEFCEILADKMPQFTCITTLDLSSNIDISDVNELSFFKSIILASLFFLYYIE